MFGKILTTDSVAPAAKEAFWRDLICDVFVQLECGNVGPEFFGSIEETQISDVQLSRVRSAQHDVLRSKRQIAKSTDDFFLISLQMAGRGVVEQDGRTAVLNPGDFVMYDSTRRYELRFRDRFEQLVLKAPRSMLRNRLAFPERLTGKRIRSSAGMARVAVEFVCSVANQVDALDPHEVERISHNVIDVMSAALGHSLINEPVSYTTSQAAQLIRIKVYILDNLRDPNLTRDEVAAANGISARYLNKLFESEQTNVMLWIRNQRFDRIARDLADPELFGRSISEIAYGWGLNSIPHFCRVFRQKYGLTPSAYRSRAAARNSA